MDDPANTCPLRYFQLPPDPRAANVRHRLTDILVIALCATICDADGWDVIEDFARAKADWFATFMDPKHGVPSADTFRRVLSRLDPEAFERCFMDWMTAVVDQSGGRLVAIDGKSIRRSFTRGWDKSGMAHLVSAFAMRNGQTLAQLKADGKGRELDAIKQLLGIIDLRHATVTIDAIGCQKSIARRIVAGDAVGQVQDRLEPVVLLPAELRHVRPTVGPGDRRQDRQRDDVVQPVQLRPFHTGVFQFVKMTQQTARGVGIHAKAPFLMRVQAARGLADGSLPPP